MRPNSLDGSKQLSSRLANIVVVTERFHAEA